MHNGEEIRITREDRSDGTEVYFLSRLVNGKYKGQYRPMDKSELTMAVVNCLNGFEPQRVHTRLDKLTD
jgi:hypothetical protein